MGVLALTDGLFSVVDLSIEDSGYAAVQSSICVLLRFVLHSNQFDQSLYWIA